MGGVRILSRRMVRPETMASPPPETIHLTPWDLKSITMEHIQKGILLPKPPTTGGHVDVERLASSFGRALGRFYPFAGRLDAVVVPASNDAASPQCQSLAISLRCGGEGAEFVHAMAPSVTAADITDSLLVPRVVWSFFPLDRLLGADPIIEGSLPLVAAQVTELADSVFIGVSMNHGVADGTTFWQFFNTWSEISRAGTDHVMISAPLPVFDRGFLRSCTVPIPLPFGKLEDVVGQRVHVFPSVQECFLQFSAASVKNLKTKANTEMSGYGNTSTISSLQAVLAHLWRAVCRARRLAPDQKTTYTVLVGCRGRVGGMPASYAGNTVEHAIAKSTAGDILDKGLGWAAWLLNEAVALFDTAYVNEKLASWPQELRFTRLPEMITVTPAELVTGSSPRFDVYGNDFGWGVPVTVRSGAGNKIDGKATVYKGQEGGGSIALEVCLAPEALARLIADVEFMGATTTHA